MAKKKKEKKELAEFDITKPEQLLLFELGDYPAERQLSNSIAFYDAVPRYVWGKSDRQAGKFLDSIERDFEVSGKKYQVTIRPARVPDTDGVEKDHFPGAREEFVEDALRRITCEGSGLFLDAEMGSVFTLYQIREELKRMGRTYSINQIRQALEVCAGTQLKITRVDENEDEYTMTFPMFETLVLHSKKEHEQRGRIDARGFVRFNPLVTKSIMKKTFRLYHYEKAIQLGHDTLARYLLKRLCRVYTFAAESKPYSVFLTTLYSDSGMQFTTIREMKQRVEKSLKELIGKEVLSHFEMEPVKEGRSIHNWRLILYPHKKFVSLSIYANRRQQQVRADLIEQDRKETISKQIQEIKSRFR